jgi:chromosome segregation ATPase
MDEEKVERTIQFILEQQANSAINQSEINARMERMERTMQFILDRQVDAEVRSQKIDEQLAILTADVSTITNETDRLHEDLLLLSSTVSAHHKQIEALTITVDKMSGRIDKLAEIVRLTRDDGHNGRG